METHSVSQDTLLEALRTLVKEAYLGPADARGTWFVDNEPDCGFVGVLGPVTAAQASRIAGYPAGASIAAHAYHIRFALDLTIRASRGERAYLNARWSDSWLKTSVTEAEWDSLRAELASQVKTVVESLKPHAGWNDAPQLTSAIALVAHGAWHLGALRQLIALL